ncbi:MAG: phage tail sheath family protein [Candidatus Scalindua sp. AMX11]|nr:phage tail sheath family protein [Planctomycetota bacterium]RZV62002.1 MAG: phage tail sheath family protein [Candidatus Scalindua sp. SCAELEC01]TDE63308.1 MAG: phage tail sheath family protein [Candidatus Scalindua sp. AMX11]GJQ57405.1 MAG: tail protein [Candidatus Scalindua sp.]
MPVTPTYPGVYIEEIPSRVRTITGVATSITAFIGRALRGPINEPITINNFGDFERIFGGLWLKSTMSFAVRDFYLNRGSQAIIVRLHNGATAAVMTMATGAPDPNDELHLEAASVGSWGNGMSVSVNYDTKYPRDRNLFNLTVSEKEGATEKFLNVSVDPDSPRYLPRVLKQRSTLVRVRKDSNDKLIMPNVRPVENTTPITPLSPPSSPATSPPAVAISGGDGNPLTDAKFFGSGQGSKTGLYALEKADLFNLLCISPYTTLAANGTAFDDSIYPTDVTTSLISKATTYCMERRAMLLVDPKSSWTNKKAAMDSFTATSNAYPGVNAPNSEYAAIFFPRLKQPNPLRDNQVEEFVPSGAVAGIFARTDAQRGVWKAPAGQEASLVGVSSLSVPLTDDENGDLNQLGINCLRAFPVYGRLVWGARTLDGEDRLASEWKYIPVRRTALFIEESLYRGSQWVVFEPNDEPLWAQIRLNFGAFMHNLFRQGAFQGTTPKDAYLVKCDKETTTQNDINLGIVNILVGFAPLKPAEFVIIKIQQLAGQIEA